ncbi:phosphate ABC transporter permease [Winogradskyella wichelsiae]|uniref:phosphate ABC transporter permease n=1 Tax=Winogradskyella wichelsiae TaxID=2697007 RepID=UPI0015CDE708|nr:phosphate ABC transporter permease [Winogradskyella wichelsiae]
MLNLKSIFILIFSLLLNHLVSSQNTNEEQKDIWSGTYNLKPYLEEQQDTINSQIYIIQKASEAKTENLTSKYKTDLLRWHMVNQNDLEKERVILRRFLINDQYNEYEEFGWTELYKSGAMKCLDGGHFFICKTIEGGTVTIDEEKFVSKTGIFGIMLHHGLFELDKIE